MYGRAGRDERIRMECRCAGETWDEGREEDVISADDAHKLMVIRHEEQFFSSS